MFAGGLAYIKGKDSPEMQAGVRAVVEMEVTEIPSAPTKKLCPPPFDSVSLRTNS